MSNTAIKIENLSKRYRLGLVGSGTLKDDLKGWWYRARGKEDPTLKIGEENRLDTCSGKYVWALKDINLEVKQGEVLGIIGKNGAGKSTLLKILSQVTGPTTGAIKTRGRIASLLEVGTGMHPELTGRENIFLNGAILGMTKAEIRAKFDEIVDFAGVARYIDTPVKRYSSGMRVRLGFAVAAFLEPEILIVDEVLAVGDAEFQKKAIGKMQDVSKGEGRTVLFVSHNMGSVRNLCQTGILLENGGISFMGKANDTVNKYIQENSTVIEDKFYQPEVDLTKHPDKKENHSYGLTGIKLYCDNKLSMHFYPGCSMKMEIIFQEKRKLQRLRVGIVIKNDSGDELIGINNENTGDRLMTIPESEGKVIISIPSLPLYGNGYFKIDLFLGDSDKDYEVLTDAAKFYLEHSDVYLSGKPPQKHVNSIYVKDIKFSLDE